VHSYSRVCGICEIHRSNNRVQIISNNTYDSKYPRVASEGANVFIVWQGANSEGPDNYYDIYLSVSNDEGRHFGKPQVISRNAGVSEKPQLAVQNGTVFIIWGDDISGNKDILFSTSTDNGRTFADPFNITNQPGYSTNHAIAVARIPVNTIMNI
jgi:hypothetical protein